MTAPTSLPCPMCGRMNTLTRMTCSTCDYEFVSGAEAEAHDSVLKRIVTRLTGRAA